MVTISQTAHLKICIRIKKNIRDQVLILVTAYIVDFVEIDEAFVLEVGTYLKCIPEFSSFQENERKVCVSDCELMLSGVCMLKWRCFDAKKATGIVTNLVTTINWC